MTTIPATDVTDTTIGNCTYFAIGKSGWCRTVAEAVTRAEQIRDGVEHTESPKGCPSLLDMRTARKIANVIVLRDGGETLRKIEAAIKAGPGTKEAWEALDSVMWAYGMVKSPMSPVKAWPTGAQQASWPHETK